MGKIIDSVISFGSKLFDEVIVRTTVETLQKAVKEGTENGLRSLKVRLLGWGNNDERISLADQTKLGHTAVVELNKFLESLNDYWTFRFRIIISGIEDQATRVDIYKMFLDQSDEDRKRILEQVCQTPEYLSKAAKWLIERFKAALSDEELRQDVQRIAGEVDRQLGKRKGTFMKYLRKAGKRAAQTVDDMARVAARSIRQYRRESAQRRQEPLGWFWRSVYVVFGYDRRLSSKWRKA